MSNRFFSGPQPRSIKNDSATSYLAHMRGPTSVLVRDGKRIEYTNESIRSDSSQTIRTDFELTFLFPNRTEPNKDFFKVGRIESSRMLSSKNRIEPTLF
jgi:hypothetical protein